MRLSIERALCDYLAAHYGESVRDEVALFCGKHFRLRHLFNVKTLLSKNSGMPRDKSVLAALSAGASKAEFAGVCYAGTRHARIFFVNGMLTPYDLALRQRDYIQALVGQPVGLVYNPTESLIADLLECHQDRVGEPSALVQGVQLQVQTAIRTSPYPVTVIGYSQARLLPPEH